MADLYYKVGKRYRVALSDVSEGAMTTFLSEDGIRPTFLTIGNLEAGIYLVKPLPNTTLVSIISKLAKYPDKPELLAQIKVTQSEMEYFIVEYRRTRITRIGTDTLSNQEIAKVIFDYLISKSGIKFSEKPVEKVEHIVERKLELDL